MLTRARREGSWAAQVEDANNPAEKKEDRDAVNFEGPTDSVYLKAPEHVELDVGTGAVASLCACSRIL